MYAFGSRSVEQVANAKSLAKERSASDGRGTAGDPDRVNEALDVSGL